MARIAAWTLALCLVAGAVAAGATVAFGGSATAGAAGPAADGGAPGSSGALASSLAGTPTDESGGGGMGTGDDDGGMDGGGMDGDGMSGGNASPPMGGLVSSVVGMEEASVDARVTVADFEERLSAAETDAGRAAAVAGTLNATDSRVATLERRLATLRERRANGSIGAGWFAVETSWLLSAAEHQGVVLDRLERAARSLPPEALARYDASLERIDRVRVRVEDLLTTDVPEIHRTTFDRAFYSQFAGFVERFNASAGGPVADALAPLAGERVVFVVGDAQFEDGETAAPVLLSVRSTPAVRFEQVRAGGSAAATVRLHMDAAVARRLVTAPRPRRALADAIRNGTVTVGEGGS